MKFLILTLSLGLSFCFNRLIADDNSPIGAVDLPCKNSKGPSPEEEAAAVAKIKVILIDKYIASLGPERQPLVLAKKSELIANPDAVLQNFEIRSRAFDKKTKQATFSAQADVNQAKISSLVDASASGEKNPIVFIFVARRQSEVKSKGPDVTTGNLVVTGSKEEASTASKGGSVSASSATTKVDNVTSKGPEVVRTADKIVYIVEDNLKAGIDRTMSKVFVDRGFDTVSAADLVDATKGVFNPDKLQKDFETSSQFSLENQRMATKSCREAGAPMLAYGTLTIGVQRPDPANDKNVVVNVIVDAQIFDCRKALAIKVGSIGALQVEGVGADQTQAETAALENAATKAASVLADQLRNRGIR